MSARLGPLLWSTTCTPPSAPPGARSGPSTGSRCRSTGARPSGIVGESGSGKTVLSRSIMGLLPPRDVLTSGTVHFAGHELTAMSQAQLRKVWGAELSMIFQDPMTALNPVKRIGRQITESLRLHVDMDRRDAKATAVELLRSVGIPSPEERIRWYPFQLSGGMRQRVMIAIALACAPRLVLADEPTTGLDVTVQAQILDLLADLQRERHMAVILVTHDLGVVANRADDIVVMYAGRVVERAPTRTLFHDTHMPYTRALMDSIPRLADSERRPGSTPSPAVPRTSSIRRRAVGSHPAVPTSRTDAGRAIRPCGPRVRPTTCSPAGSLWSTGCRRRRWPPPPSGGRRWPWHRHRPLPPGRQGDWIVWSPAGPVGSRIDHRPIGRRTAAAPRPEVRLHDGPVGPTTPTASTEPGAPPPGGIGWADRRRHRPHRRSVWWWSSGAGVRRCTRCPVCPSRSETARPWGWWASRGAGSRPPAGPWCRSSHPRRAR